MTKKIKEINEKYLNNNIDYFQNDLIYINKETEQILWIYYTPNSSHGGKFVEISIPFGLFKRAVDKLTIEECCNFIRSKSMKYSVDIDSNFFSVYIKNLLTCKPDIKYYFNCNKENELMSVEEKEQLINIIKSKI